MRYLILILAISLTSLICGCKKSDSDSIGLPGKSALLFPAQNSVCTNGNPSSATQRIINLSWVASSNTDSYDLTIKNLITGTTTTTNISNNTANVNLDDNTPYSWFVTSKNSKDTISSTSSDIWKFYVTGPGIEYYAPFPAIIIAPVFNQSFANIISKVNLSWTGSDPDNDIAGYDIYLGADNNPPIYKSNISTPFLNDIMVVPATTYYWKIITKDSKGNTSDSGIYQFIIK